MQNFTYPENLDVQIPLTEDSPLVYSRLKNFNAIKKKAIQAIREGKIFMIVGTYPVLRDELINRGWVEKKSNTNFPSANNNQKTNQIDADNEFEQQLLSNLVSDYPADFVFSCSYEIGLRFVHDFAFWNRIKINRLKDFTFKDGLCNCVRDAHYYTYPDKAEMNVPRSFFIQDGQLGEFEDEYEITLCRNFILFLHENIDSITSDAVTGIYPSDIVDLVCQFLENRIQCATTHVDIDEIFEPMELTEEQKEIVTSGYYQIVENEVKIWVDDENLEQMREKIQNTSEALLKLWPGVKDDGYHNLWVVKPLNLCGGNGVKIFNSTTDMVRDIPKKPFCGRCIIQKYIERPLLIHQTKFDIRYFFMVTIDSGSLKIWDHSSCYLRFCSTEFDLKNLNEQIHLTNHTVQMRYPSTERNDQLPPYNMWSLSDFLTYLENNDKVDLWWNTIYPAIKKNLVGVVMSSVEEMEFKPNRYHIYGADFLITEDFNVYLLEVNCSPALSFNTTVVTEVIFRQVLEDALKGKKVT